MSTRQQSPARATNFKVLPTREDVARAVAEEFAKAVLESISRSGRFSVALAGGSTPREAYIRIAAGEKDGTRRLPWDKIHVFFGDERPVPPEDAASNYRMANESLLSQVPIPPQNVHRIKGEMDASLAVREYEVELREFFPKPIATSFDLVLLGMGPDGHTASLFPGTSALNDVSSLVAANWVEKLNQTRLTLTLPLLNAAARVLFVVVGNDKADVLRQVLTGTEVKYPAQLIKPISGRVQWIIDEEAAQQLPRDLEHAV